MELLILLVAAIITLGQVVDTIIEIRSDKKRSVRLDQANKDWNQNHADDWLIQLAKKSGLSINEFKKKHDLLDPNDTSNGLSINDTSNGLSINDTSDDMERLDITSDDLLELLPSESTIMSERLKERLEEIEKYMIDHDIYPNEASPCLIAHIIFNNFHQWEPTSEEIVYYSDNVGQSYDEYDDYNEERMNHMD